jgi:thiol-disulfide isomerase/thioredoxin
MNKFFFVLFLTGILLTPFFSFANTEGKNELPVVYLFYSEGCSHCEKELIFLDDLKKEISCLEIQKYEVSRDQTNKDLFLKTAGEFGIKNLAVPLTVIGDKYLIGFDNPENSGEIIKKMIETGNAGITNMVSPPIFGKIDLKSLSLPFLTLILGVLDGFNPCSMWSLFVLLTLVIATGSRRKVWLVGGVFIMTSAFSYFLFMSAWLNAFILLEYVKTARIVVGIVAIIAGIVSIREFYKFKPGVCETSSSERQNKVYDRIKNVLKPPGTAAIIAGVMLIAFSVNFVEMLCSLGLPVIYTKALAMHNLAKWKYYVYIGLYDFFYMLDDIIVLAVAGFSMRFLQLNGKYSRYSRLIAGILMFILGSIFIFKPELLALK